jgi:peptidoglycan/LPS O-acetylase OafA/YrhL
MSRRARNRRRVELEHLGGLDGLRAVAVLGVLLYHGGVSAAGGGFLGVEVFFVLSGFLITSLLVIEWLGTGRVLLPSFWARRARRLLPALFALILAIGVFYASAGPTRAVPGFLGDGLAALLYFSNWHQIAVGASYFATSGPISPFQHTWSLAIEEQFYLLWPLLLLGILGLATLKSPRGSVVGRLRLLLALTLLGAVGSLVLTGVLFDGGHGLYRVYYGTDTRASGLLAGAALAILLAIRRQLGGGTGAVGAVGAGAVGAGAGAGRHRRLLGWGALGLLGLVLAGMAAASGSAGWLYPWGLGAVDLLVVGIIATVALLPGSPVDRALSAPPLQFVGRISYGLYLWHFPLFLWLDSSATGLTGVGLLALRLAVTLLVSLFSYVFIEQPIRLRRRPTWNLRWLAPLGAGAATASLMVAATASSLPTGVPVAATLPAPPPHLTGSGPACSVSLADTPGYGVAPVPRAGEAEFEYRSLAQHVLRWTGSATKAFHTCPPKRVLLVGDSIAFTLGVPMLADEQRYGTELADAAILGCAFSTRGQLDVNGTWQPASGACPDALSQWAADERRFRPGVVVVELGYRDEFDWRWNGRIVHLGQAAFDAYLQAQINHYVRVLGSDGTRVLLLSVPFTDPPAQSDGSPAPAASPQRHRLINQMLVRAAARANGNAAVLDIDQTVSPGNHYDGKVDGQLCRFDGIHFSVFCAELLESRVLSGARALLGR